MELFENLGSAESFLAHEPLLFGEDFLALDNECRLIDYQALYSRHSKFFSFLSTFNFRNTLFKCYHDML